ncbi:MAG: sterol desaturase family protein [Pseudomonadota bacterium]
MGAIEEFVISQQATIRLGIFVLLIAVFTLLEYLLPRLQFDGRQSLNRKSTNIALLIIDIIALRLLIPLAAFELAIWMKTQGWGLFNFIALPIWFNVIISIIVFDLLIYLQHVAFHKYSILWRIHRVHHTDLQFDVTTGVRFHPIEIVLSMCYKLVAIFLLGPAAIAIILYEILLNSASLFTHSNLSIGKKTDGLLRKVFVTPDMHRVHHSSIKIETDSNYGNLFSCWDKIFHTYIAQPQAGHDNMVIGLENSRPLSLVKTLKNPFLKDQLQP